MSEVRRRRVGSAQQSKNDTRSQSLRKPVLARMSASSGGFDPPLVLGAMRGSFGSGLARARGCRERTAREVLDAGNHVEGLVAASMAPPLHLTRVGRLDAGFLPPNDAALRCAAKGEAITHADMHTCDDR